MDQPLLVIQPFFSPATFAFLPRFGDFPSSITASLCKTTYHAEYHNNRDF
jgi:hypothetical protein